MELTLKVTVNEEMVNPNEVVRFLKSQQGIDDVEELVWMNCSVCGWRGLTSQIVVKYVQSLSDHTDVIPEASCPCCGNEQGLEDTNA